MEILSVGKATASLNRVIQTVITMGNPVVVRTPHGLVQIAPYELAKAVPPAPKGSLKLLPREIELGNRLGVSL